MVDKDSIIIRKFDIKDREELRHISHVTAFMGAPSAAFFDDADILADALTIYFTDYEPESSFVAESQGRVIGYLTGAKDKNTLDRIFQAKIVPRLLFKAIFRGALLKKKNISFMFYCLLSLIKGEFKEPDFSPTYPAILHINLKEDFRSLGVGARLINAYLEYLSKEQVPGVHLATFSEKAGRFFTKQGFNLLYQCPRSYFRHLLHRDISIYIYGKKLP